MHVMTFLNVKYSSASPRNLQSPTSLLKILMIPNYVIIKLIVTDTHKVFQWIFLLISDINKQITIAGLLFSY